jgi:hypothetical protein
MIKHISLVLVLLLLSSFFKKDEINKSALKILFAENTGNCVQQSIKSDSFFSELTYSDSVKASFARGLEDLIYISPSILTDSTSFSEQSADLYMLELYYSNCNSAQKAYEYFKSYTTHPSGVMLGIVKMGCIFYKIKGESKIVFISFDFSREKSKIDELRSLIKRNNRHLEGAFEIYGRQTILK